VQRHATGAGDPDAMRPTAITDRCAGLRGTPPFPIAFILNSFDAGGTEHQMTELIRRLHRTPPEPDDVVRDVLTNRARIEEMTGTPAVHLCDPSGNYRACYLPALERLGITSTATCDPGLAARTSHPLLLPRFVDTGSVTTAVFQAWLPGLADRLPRRTRFRTGGAHAAGSAGADEVVASLAPALLSGPGRNDGHASRPPRRRADKARRL
jgi:hypothetical protein